MARAWRIPPALEVLRNEVNRLAPNRSKVSDGSIGDQAHATSKSDHNVGARGFIHAIDITNDPNDGCDCNDLAEQIKDDPRVSYLIWRRRIYNPMVSRTWRRYSGANPHDKHLHVSIRSTVGAESDRSPWLGRPKVVGATQSGAVGEEDEMAEPVDAIDALTKDGRRAGTWVLTRAGRVVSYRGAPHHGDYVSLPPENRQGHHEFGSLDYGGGFGYVLIDTCPERHHYAFSAQ